MTPHVAAAEYLALTIARRTGADPDRLAELTGLTPLRCWQLTRTRDLAEIQARRDALNAYTKGTHEYLPH